MDLYAESSADIFLKDNEKVISLKSKFMLACPIAQGIRLLRDCSIVHMDLKFQNVLIGRGLIPRITDFGESIVINNPATKKNIFTSGYTLPYTSH